MAFEIPALVRSRGEALMPTPRRPGPDVVNAWRALLKAHAGMTDLLEGDLRAARHVSLSSYDVLLQLDEADGSLRMADLARAVLLSKSGLTRLVDRMAAAGLVERSRDPIDGRGVRVGITAAGRRAFRRAAPIHLQGIATYFGSAFTAAEARVLAELLGRVPRSCPAELDSASS